MIEKTILDFLTQKLTAQSGSTPVYMEVPKNAPSSFVLIEKTGGGEKEGIYTATVAIQSYGSTLYNAASVNETVKGYMEGIADELTGVSACRLNSDYNFTDPNTKRYRYQAVFNLVYF